MVLEVFRRLEGGDCQEADQHRIDQSVIGGDEDHHVVDLPLAVDPSAHERMNQDDADECNEKEKRAASQRQFQC